MSRTIKGTKGSGFEWWSLRNCKGIWTPKTSTIGKKITNKKERRDGKKIDGES